MCISIFEFSEELFKNITSKVALKKYETAVE